MTSSPTLQRVEIPHFRTETRISHFFITLPEPYKLEEEAPELGAADFRIIGR